MRKRRRFTTEFKATVALGALKGQRPIHELAKDFHVHPNQITHWKKQLIDGASQLFGRGQDKGASAQSAELDRTYRQVGRLQVEVDWFKKKSDIWNEHRGKALHGGAGSSDPEHSPAM